MNEEIQRLLKSPLADDRKRGVQLLAKSGDPQALKILSVVHKREKDAALRQFISEVGNALKRGGKSSQAMNNADKAATLLEQANDAVESFEFKDAEMLARRAFKLNPNLESDDSARDLFAEIFTTSPDEAIASLKGEQTATNDMDTSDWLDALDNPQSAKRKSKTPNTNVSWWRGLIPIGFYGVASGVFFYLISILIFAALGLNLEAIAEEIVADQSLYEQNVAMQDFWNDYTELSGRGMGVIVEQIPGVVLGSMMFYVIYLGMIHLMAKVFLKGTGSYAGLLGHSFISMFIGLIVLYLIAAFLSFILISALEYSVKSEDLSALDVVYSWISFCMPIHFIGFSIWLSIVIGKSHNFGIIKGCGSIIISSIAWAVIGACFACMGLLVAGSALQSMLSGVILPF